MLTTVKNIGLMAAISAVLGGAAYMMPLPIAGSRPSAPNPTQCAGPYPGSLAADPATGRLVYLTRCNWAGTAAIHGGTAVVSYGPRDTQPTFAVSPDSLQRILGFEHKDRLLWATTRARSDKQATSTLKVFAFDVATGRDDLVARLTLPVESQVTDVVRGEACWAIGTQALGTRDRSVILFRGGKLRPAETPGAARPLFWDAPRKAFLVAVNSGRAMDKPPTSAARSWLSVTCSGELSSPPQRLTDALTELGSSGEFRSALAGRFVAARTVGSERDRTEWIASVLDLAAPATTNKNAIGPILRRAPLTDYPPTAIAMSPDGSLIALRKKVHTEVYQTSDLSLVMTAPLGDAHDVELLFTTDHELALVAEQSLSKISIK